MKGFDQYCRSRFFSFGIFVSTLFFLLSCNADQGAQAQESAEGLSGDSLEAKPKLTEIRSTKIKAVLSGAFKQIRTTTSYTQKYYSIAYPNGDVPKNTGACTDVVIRSFRKAGVDLQKNVHEDMKANFSKYPKKWGLRRTDTNIDHRRVPNLQTYFRRKGKSLQISLDGSAYRPGDVVSWDLNGKGLTHIGLVSNIWNKEKKRYLIIHNIGGGTELEDRLFDWKITGHYRFWSINSRSHP